MEKAPVFPNYMQVPRHLPIVLWRVIQGFILLAALGLCYVLLTHPETGLLLLWGISVPLLPLVFFFSPGLWRNFCPLAMSNQLPRLFGFSIQGTAPAWFTRYSYVLGIVLFFLLASGRKILFNTDAFATAVLILGALTMAFVGGVLLKGKSGWCSSICPLLPVQRIYGQTPFALLPNSHCQPCVGCTKNCYDFNPRVAYIADQYDQDRNYSAYRRFFAAAFPGFVLAFYTLPNPPEISAGAMYLQFLLYMLVSAGAFTAIDAFASVSSLRVTTIFGALALNIYYWYTAPTLFQTVGELTDQTVHPAFSWAVRLGLFIVTLVWISRTYQNEQAFLEEMMPAPFARVSPNASRSLDRTTLGNELLVTFQPSEVCVMAEKGNTLLDIAEANNLQIEAGCRMGMCGADPVTILSGMSNLSEVSTEERSTIERLMLSEKTRMACSARVSGNVTVSLTLEPASPVQKPVPTRSFDPDIKTVVIIGNGIAGVTAADHVRRHHSECEIHVIGRERYHLYNRMAITRLIYGRSAMQGLMLMPETWYEDRKITCWLNTRVTRIDRTVRTVHLGMGETLHYDRLIIAAGSSSFVPPIENFGQPGTFVIREADDAMNIRSYFQEHLCKQSVVMGGGLLGLEAAFALRQLNIEVTVLERGPWLIRQQLDQSGAEILRRYLEQLGIRIALETEVTSVETDGSRVQRIHTKSGKPIACDLFLVCVGIVPNASFYKETGLDVNRGIVVNNELQTSDPAVFAAGDVAEHRGSVMGLWTSAVRQAEVAAINAIGGHEIYNGTLPETVLKVAGIDLTSIGRFQPESDSEIMITELNEKAHTYRKLVVSNGKIAGAILIGHPKLAPGVARTIKAQRDISGFTDQLRAGNWSALE